MNICCVTHLVSTPLNYTSGWHWLISQTAIVLHVCTLIISDLLVVTVQDKERLKDSLGHGDSLQQSLFSKFSKWSMARIKKRLRKKDKIKILSKNDVCCENVDHLKQTEIL